MTAATTKIPDAESPIESWKDWLHDHTDMHLGTVILPADVVLDLVKARDSGADQLRRLREAWDAERERL